MFNARAETVAEKPMFREAFKRRRCLIPASGFYEWTGGKGDKIRICSQWRRLAGLWDRWRNPATGEGVLSCTIIVSGASEWMPCYHNRMPVLIAQHDFEIWLFGDTRDDMLVPVAEAALR